MALSTGQTILLLVSFLVFGSMNTILTKVQFSIESVGSDGESKLFKKPWFQTFNMMLAMFYVLAHRCCSKKAARDVEHLNVEAGLSGGGRKPSFAKKVLMVSLPAFFDIVATALGAAGMLYIPASLWQMLRGSSLVFAALFSILFLQHKMRGFHWLGLLLCVVGVSTVGTANILDSMSSKSLDAAAGSSATDMIVGISLVISAQVVQAAQVIAEEFLMKDCDLPAFDVVGFEGMWGVLQFLILVYPVLYIANVEDPFDTLVMVKNSTGLLFVVFAFQFSCATFNMTGIAITGCLSAVHRMMIDASRTMVVWGFGLFVHYQMNEESLYGEVWTKYSKVQFLGFCILVLGQATYGKVLKWPCLSYVEDVLPGSPSLLDFSNQGSPCAPSPATLKMGASMMAVEEAIRQHSPIKSPQSSDVMMQTR
jgi:drug/metabolite transporter (DMT)-like permease